VVGECHKVVNFRRIGLRNILLLATPLLLAACDDGNFSDLHQYVADVKARPKGTIEPIPEIKPVEPFVFKPEGLRDPFRSISETKEAEETDVGGGDGIKPDTSRRKEELEAYSLDSLRMVGTVTKQGNLWALIKASDKTVHRVQLGNHLGKNYGKIIRILPDKIEIMEIVPDKPGSWREQQTSLVLAEAETDAKAE
jgi:type IV pilus assembly protein PilP